MRNTFIDLVMHFKGTVLPDELKEIESRIGLIRFNSMSSSLLSMLKLAGKNNLFRPIRIDGIRWKNDLVEIIQSTEQFNGLLEIKDGNVDISSKLSEEDKAFIYKYVSEHYTPRVYR